ncbi:N-terminal region of Chorein, a TM vesicle-mediated sorter-domain-containing protein [Pavlovales sp. CCMP2436]|nr:N-terminal region of Chorein, a TM vesicle-mediated sorter-domain-containing protein [Pavlovales sp. CCMP2436]
MLKALFLDVLQRYISEYVKADTRSLRLALEGGFLELRDLEVRREAFDNLGLPFQVKAGYVGLLRVQLPWLAAWRAGGAESIAVHIESAYLLVAPRWDGRGLSLPAQPSGPEARRDKQRGLAAAEQLLRSAGAGGGGARQLVEALSSNALLARLLTGLLDAVHVTLRNVHVRVEDEGALTGTALSMGLMLAEAELRPGGFADEEDLDAGSSDSDAGGEAEAGKGAAADKAASADEPLPPGVEQLRKALRLRSLRFYLDPGGRQIPVEFLDALGTGADGVADARLCFEQLLQPPAEAVALRPFSASAVLEVRLRKPSSGAQQQAADERASRGSVGSQPGGSGGGAAGGSAGEQGAPPAARGTPEHPAVDVRLECTASGVDVSLSEAQWRCVLRLLQFGTNVRRWLAFWRRRPAEGWPTDGSSARAWWRYACTCVAEEEAKRVCRFRIRWEEIAARRALRQRYVKLWRSNFRSRAQSEELLCIEDTLRVQEILLFRSWPEATGAAAGAAGGLAALWNKVAGGGSSGVGGGGGRDKEATGGISPGQPLQPPPTPPPTPPTLPTLTPGSTGSTSQSGPGRLGALLASPFRSTPTQPAVHLGGSAWQEARAGTPGDYAPSFLSPGALSVLRLPESALREGTRSTGEGAARSAGEGAARSGGESSREGEADSELAQALGAAADAAAALAAATEGKGDAAAAAAVVARASVRLSAVRVTLLQEKEGEGREGGSEGEALLAICVHGAAATLSARGTTVEMLVAVSAVEVRTFIIILKNKKNA